jgi:hypothetical protein
MATSSSEYIHNVQGFKAAFNRYQSVSVSELNHDPSDLLAFFVEDMPGDPSQGPAGAAELAEDASQLPVKVLVDGLPWEERNTVYNCDPDTPTANGQRHFRTGDGFHLFRSVTGSWFFSTRFTPKSDVCLASLRGDSLLGTHNWNVLIAPRTWMQMPVTIRGPVPKRDAGLPTSNGLDLTACGFCGEPGATKRCSRCRQQCYCDAACQRAAWAEHKTVCVDALNEAAGSAAAGPLPVDNSEPEPEPEPASEPEPEPAPEGPNGELPTDPDTWSVRALKAYLRDIPGYTQPRGSLEKGDLICGVKNARTQALR